MGINPDILITWGAKKKKYKKGEMIFSEGDLPYCYYQIISGAVKMVNIKDDGREFNQGVFKDGEGFGEPPLIIEKPYPSTAIACQESIIYRLNKTHFFKILEDYPSICSGLLVGLSHRLYTKALINKNLIISSPEKRILNTLHDYKKKNCVENRVTHIALTRQEVANITGLRVETVIRTLSKMKDEGKVKIENRKLYF